MYATAKAWVTSRVFLEFSDFTKPGFFNRGDILDQIDKRRSVHLVGLDGVVNRSSHPIEVQSPNLRGPD